MLDLFIRRYKWWLGHLHDVELSWLDAFTYRYGSFQFDYTVVKEWPSVCQMPPEIAYARTQTLGAFRQVLELAACQHTAWNYLREMPKMYALSQQQALEVDLPYGKRVCILASGLAGYPDLSRDDRDRLHSGSTVFETVTEKLQEAYKIRLFRGVRQ